ncbi:MAG: AraC family transcriptional regulator [Bacteroidales bacterium]
MKTNTRIIKEITPLSDKDCFYVADRNKKDFTYPMHSHAEYELNFIANASGVRRIVGDSVELIGDFDLVLIASRDLEHVWEQHECKSTDVREITIQFSADMFFSSYLDKSQFKSLKTMFEMAQKGLSFPMLAIMNVYPMLDKLAHENTGFYSVLNFLAILYELSLFSDKAKTLSSSAYAKTRVHSESRRVEKVKSFINDNYTEEIRLSQLAEMVGMTSSSFSRFFKLRTGKGLTDYIIEVRLGHASRLLVDTQMTISELAYRCGFNNLSNFNRIFRKHKQCSPKEFRDNYSKRKMLI